MMQLLLYIIVAVIIGLLGAALFGFKVPGGIVGAMVAGLLGAWIGDIVIGQLGPKVGGYNVFPAVLGALVVTVIIALLGKRAKIVR